MRIYSFFALMAAVNLLGCGNQSVEVPDAKPPRSEQIEVGNEQPKKQKKPAIEEPVEVSFKELALGMDSEDRFERSMLRPSIKELDGRRITITGIMMPGVDQLKGITRFQLSQTIRGNSFSKSPGDTVIDVIMLDSATADYTDQRIEVTGVLRIDPVNGPDPNGPTYAVYRMSATSVENKRRR